MTGVPSGMQLAEYPEIYQEALAYWCAFRNLGFEAAEIFLGFGEVSGVPHCLFLQLQAQGKIFTATAGRIPDAVETDVHAKWKEVAGVLQESTLEERNALFKRSRIGRDESYFAAFMVAIRGKGIHFPALGN